MNADTELDSLFLRNVGVLFGHFFLDFHRTARCIDGARELDQDAIPSGLDDTTFVLGDLGIDQLAAQRFEACQRAGLIVAHQPAISRDIRREDCCEPALDPLEFVRTIAVARICMPRSVVRLSAGREDMSEETQALCFLAGANSVFYGPKLLTTPNPGRDRDRELMDRLGLSPMEPAQTGSRFGAP